MTQNMFFSPFVVPESTWVCYRWWNMCLEKRNKGNTVIMRLDIYRKQIHIDG